jgi:hypothetical protein
MNFGGEEWSMSREASTKAFNSSSAKDHIRNVIDRKIIQEFQQEYHPGKELAYLGLPGGELDDLLSWWKFIGRWTAVQKVESNEEREALEALEFNIMWHRLEREDSSLVVADIDQLLSCEKELERLSWPFHIVNLDYNGGLIDPKQRLAALESLFGHQEDSSFVLFLTLNLKDDDQGELDDLVQQQEEELISIGKTGVKECFNKHRELVHAGLLKVYVPIYLNNIARRHTLRFKSPILYQGTKQMIHFAVVCIPYQALRAGRVSTVNDRIRLINLPLDLLHSQDNLKRIQLGCIE